MNSCKKEKFIVIPEWNSKVHTIFINEALSNEYQIITAQHLYTRSFFIWVFSLMYLPKLVFYLVFKHFQHLTVWSVNVGSPIIQETIRNSKRAQFYDFRNGVLICKLFIKAISVIQNFTELQNRRRHISVLGGDSAYVTFSIISQLSHKSVYIVAQDLVSLTEFDKRALSASGAHRWLNPLDYNCLKNGLTPVLRHDFQKPKIYMNQSDREIYDGVYEKRTLYIYAHDFFDSPGVYGDNIFTDHVDWVWGIIRICRKYGIRMVLKRHPNERPESATVAEQFEPVCQQIFGDLNLDKIRNSESVICTVFGTIANEAYLHNVPVIACGSGPFNTLPNVTQAHDQYHLDLILKNFSTAEKISSLYVINTRQNKHSCYTQLGNLKFNYAYNLPYNDCWEAHWMEFMEGEYPKNSFERRERLKNMSVSEQYRFKLFLQNSNEFRYFSTFLKTVLSSQF